MPDEDEWQAVTHNVVEVHDVVKTVRGRQLHEASMLPVRHFDEGEAALGQAQRLGLFGFLNQQVYAVVLKLADFVDFGEPYGVGVAVEAVVVISFQEGGLLLVELRVVYKAYVVLLKSLEHFVYCYGVFLAELRVELVYCFDGLAYVVVLLAYFLVVGFEQAVQRRHAHTEELVEVV